MEKVYWSSFRHNGVYVPPPPEYHGLSVSVNGKPVKLSPEAEEMAFAWVKIQKNPRVLDPVFKKNFLKDFVKKLKVVEKPRSIDEIDFSEVIKVYRSLAIKQKRNKKLNRERSLHKRQLKKIYGYALIDGRRVEVANWMVEPPGIFLGRGEHPLRGRWKPRVTHKDITLNLSRDAPVPPGRWGGIVHDPSAMWVARWRDKLTGKIKYVWLHESSRIRQSKDKEKFDKALKLASRIERVRRYIVRSLHSRNIDTRKVATVCYLIDKLGMRVGDEKDKDEADTVGATTLRVEHVIFKKDSIEFRFLGKDSVPWHKSIKIYEVDPAFVTNLHTFVKGKRPTDQIFDDVSSASVNKFLGKFMRGLTAKVFRTYHATRVVEMALTKYTNRAKRSNKLYKIYYAKLANLEAAVFCNHKRTVAKNYLSSLRKKNKKLEELLKVEPKTQKQQRRFKLKRLKLELEIDLLKRTKDYNLATSLKNYIDPRVYKAWADYVKLDWRELYTKSLQRKFGWAAYSKWTWPNGQLEKKAVEERVIQKLT
ncbi:MAG: DNA topoisomerase I [Thermoprotei archaeon]